MPLVYDSTPALARNTSPEHGTTPNTPVVLMPGMAVPMESRCGSELPSGKISHSSASLEELLTRPTIVLAGAVSAIVKTWPPGSWSGASMHSTTPPSVYAPFASQLWTAAEARE